MTLVKYVFIVLASCFLLAFIQVDPEPKNKAELGKLLFFDPILSKDSSISCASCHKPEFAFADNVAISPGINDRKGRRNAPSVMNMSARDLMFFDGRAADLNEQVRFPIEDHNEMGIPLDSIVLRLQSDMKYNNYFHKIYKESPSKQNISHAIATFERSLETSNTEFDAYMNDLPNTMSDAAIRGRQIFMSDRAKCFDCHFSPDFTGDDFKNIGLYDEVKYKDKGRYEVTKKSEDLGKFKVPGLRNVAVTAPYMHDGSFKTLNEVLKYYSNPYDFVKKPINLDTTLLKPINFTEKEISDLEAFLVSLTDRRFAKSTNEN